MEEEGGRGGGMVHVVFEVVEGRGRVVDIYWKFTESYAFVFVFTDLIRKRN